MTEVAATTGVGQVLVVTNTTVISDCILQRLKEHTSQAKETHSICPPSWSYTLCTSLANMDALLTDVSRLPLPDLVLLVQDDPDDSFEQAALERCRALDVPVLPILGRGPVVSVGPWERPSQLGCVSCLELRWNHSFRRVRLRQAMERQTGTRHHGSLALSLSAADLIGLASLVAEEVEDILSTGSSRLTGKVGLYKRGEDIRYVDLLVSHDCRRCSYVPTDNVQLGNLQFQSRSLYDPTTLRVRRIASDELLQRYVDKDLGYISEFYETVTEERYFRAKTAIQHPGAMTHFGYGAATSKETARVSAILEALERSCGIRCTDRRPSVFAPYNSLADSAVDPLSFGVHAESAYLSHPYLKPYDPERPYSFVWGYSTLEKRPVLVPEQLAYYGMSHDTSRFVKESSSGCALGGSLEEAVLHGIFEVLERDGLLNTWFAKLSVPEVLLGEDAPTDVQDIITLLANKGFAVRLFDIAHDIGIPAIMAVAVNERHAAPKVVCGSSCHLNPYEAVQGALRELAVQVFHLSGLSQKELDAGKAMLENPVKIEGIAHHALVSALPEAYENWSFLLDGNAKRIVLPLQEVYDGTAERFKVDSRDIGVILSSVLEHIHSLGFDVIVVRQTSFEVAAGGFEVVKVLIPGMTPITFGYGARRLQGLRRVFELPDHLGYSSHILTNADLNPNCHPLA